MIASFFREELMLGLKILGQTVGDMSADVYLYRDDAHDAHQLVS